MITKKKEYVCAICHRRYISEKLPFGWIELDENNENGIDFTHPNETGTPDHVCERCKLRPFTTFLTEAKRRKEEADRQKKSEQDDCVAIWADIIKTRFNHRWSLL